MQFAKLYGSFLKLGLNSDEILLLVEIVNKSQDHGYCWVSNEYLCNYMQRRLSIRGIQRALASLEEAGIIKRVNNPQNCEHKRLIYFLYQNVPGMEDWRPRYNKKHDTTDTTSVSQKPKNTSFNIEKKNRVKNTLTEFLSKNEFEIQFDNTFNQFVKENAIDIKFDINEMKTKFWFEYAQDNKLFPTNRIRRIPKWIKTERPTAINNSNNHSVIPAVQLQEQDVNDPAYQAFLERQRRRAM